MNDEEHARLQEAADKAHDAYVQAEMAFDTASDALHAYRAENLEDILWSGDSSAPITGLKGLVEQMQENNGSEGTLSWVTFPPIPSYVRDSFIDRLPGV